MVNFLSWYYAFFGIHWLPFVIPAALALFARLVLRRVSRREVLFLSLVILLLLLEAVQLDVTGCSYAYGHQDFLVTWERYFGVVAPLLWAWAACGFFMLTKALKGQRVIRALISLAAVGGLAYVFFAKNIAARYHEATEGAGRDAMIAGRRIARVIEKDYKGPRRHLDFPYQLSDYYTSRRPVVVSFWGCAAWACNGQSQGVSPGYPFPDDYLFARVDRRFKKEGLGYALEHSPDHEFVYEVMGVNYRWRLYRRTK